jgi:hypothetical protein
MSKRDLDEYERQGVLLRLDQKHPWHEFLFLDHFYFPCNAERLEEKKSEEIKQAYAKATSEVGFNFWDWFKVSLEGGVGYEDNDSSISITRTKVISTHSSVFQQWGLMKGTIDGDGKDTPFFVEKVFECQPGAGTGRPGSKIISVEIKFWNHEEDKNDVFEFDGNRLSKWIDMDEDIYSNLQRPVFLSINSSEKQAAIIEKILAEEKTLHFNQAVFIFSQLNNRCGSKDREKCDELVSVK